MLTKTYQLENRVIVTDAAIVITSANRSCNNNSGFKQKIEPVIIDDPDNEGEKIPKKVRTLEDETPVVNDWVHYTVGIFADVEAFHDGINAAESLGNGASQNQYRFKYEDVEGESLRAKCYNHLLTIEQFKDATSIEGEIY